ncbi:MAG: nucleotidyltransferase domain-containing protein [Proteobacteria bacterium]|nr:nucleotidyltransferase domain-containing protein [Pseudomonadota bacterium]
MKKALVNSLTKELRENIPEIDFAFLFGSAMKKPIDQCQDVDIGAYLNTTVSLELIGKILEKVETLTKCRCDLSILNTASEILRFEALKGILLFVRDNKLEDYSSFYSLTCREYEDKMFWMKRQLSYRGYV